MNDTEKTNDNVQQSGLAGMAGSAIPDGVSEESLRQQGYKLTDAELLAEIGSEGRPPIAASLKTGLLAHAVYIWKTPDGRQRVVKLNTAGDGMTTLHDNDEWYFEHDLVGTVHGPFYLC